MHGIPGGLFENLPVGLGSDLELKWAVVLIRRECPSHLSWEGLKIHAYIWTLYILRVAIWWHVFYQQAWGVCLLIVHNPHFSLISSPYNLVKIAKLVDKPWEYLTRGGSDLYHSRFIQNPKPQLQFFQSWKWWRCPLLPSARFGMFFLRRVIGQEKGWKRGIISPHFPGASG